MIVTFQTLIHGKPTLLRRGEDVRIDLGSALLEFDMEGFKNFIAEIHTQAAKQGIYLPTLK